MPSIDRKPKPTLAGITRFADSHQPASYIVRPEACQCFCEKECHPLASRTSVAGKATVYLSTKGVVLLQQSHPLRVAMYDRDGT